MVMDTQTHRQPGNTVPSVANHQQNQNKSRSLQLQLHVKGNVLVIHYF